MQINGYNFGCFKREYMDGNSELWRAIFINDIGNIVEDHIVITWKKPYTEVVLLTNVNEHTSSLEYKDLIFSLFHNVCEYKFTSVIQDDPSNYKVEEQILFAKEKFKI